jgi:hypothetical protein
LQPQALPSLQPQVHLGPQLLHEQAFVVFGVLVVLVFMTRSFVCG